MFKMLLFSVGNLDYTNCTNRIKKFKLIIQVIKAFINLYATFI